MPFCPVCGAGCRPVKHGCYWRKYPRPIPIARFYCAPAKTTFSLLPDFLSSRYRGSLAEFEQVCVAAEDADSLAVANAERPVETAFNISARSAQRWVARRIVLFEIMLLALLGVAIDRVEGVKTASQLRKRLCCAEALVALRSVTAQNLASLPPPLGFGPWPNLLRCASLRRQHAMASEPDAPSG